MDIRENEIGLWSDGGEVGSGVAYKNENNIVYITRTGKKYHREGCSYLGGSKIPISLKDACKKSYVPCPGCNPPGSKIILIQMALPWGSAVRDERMPG